MTLYLTDNTTEEMVQRVHESEHVFAFKLYPAGMRESGGAFHEDVKLTGATTNSQSGVTDVWKMLPVFKTMADLGVPLLVHGEVTDASIDVFDREAVFIQRIMVRCIPPCSSKRHPLLCQVPLLDRVPKLKVVMEHITTKNAVRVCAAV